MKTFSALLMLATASFAHPEAQPFVPRENRVILPAHWTPTFDRTDKALEAVHQFLRTPDGVYKYQKVEIQKILANISGYCVQFTGEHVKGRKIIRCNFFPAKRVQTGFPDWKKSQVVVCDGGFWFWTIDYDLETNACSGFASNGYG